MRYHIRQLGDNAVNQSRLYVSHNDIMAQPCFGKDIVFAVKAPRGTTLEVPNPDALSGNDQQYKVLLNSKGEALVRRGLGEWGLGASSTSARILWCEGAAGCLLC
jgi:hypothetical protein